jgi:hypothetical protein
LGCLFRLFIYFSRRRLAAKHFSRVPVFICVDTKAFGVHAFLSPKTFCVSYQLSFKIFTTFIAFVFERSTNKQKQKEKFSQTNIKKKGKALGKQKEEILNFPSITFHLLFAYAIRKQQCLKCAATVEEEGKSLR